MSKSKEEQSQEWMKEDNQSVREAIAQTDKMNEIEKALNTVRELLSFPERKGYWKEKIWASEERLEALKTVLKIAEGNCYPPVAQQFLDSPSEFPSEQAKTGLPTIDRIIEAENKMRSLCLLAHNAEIEKAREEIDELAVITLKDKEMVFKKSVLSLTIFKEVK